MKKICHCVRVLLLFMSFVSCQSKAEKMKSKVFMRLQELTFELQKIETQDDLIQKGDILKKKYEEIVDAIIAVTIYCQKTSSQIPQITDEEEINHRLELELSRLYKLPGALFLLEKYQANALIRLDAFEKKQKILKAA